MSPSGPLEWGQVAILHRGAGLPHCRGNAPFLTLESYLGGSCLHHEQHEKEIDGWEPSTAQRGLVDEPLHYLNNHVLLLGMYNR